MRLKALIVPIGLLCLTQTLAAQTSSGKVAIAPGTRIRVSTPSLVAPLVANFLEQRGDTLVVIEDGRGRGVWSFDLAQVERIETTAGQVGRSSSAIKKGALIGGAIGLATGIIFAASFDPSNEDRRYSRMQTGIVAGLAGAGFGAFIGMRVTTEKWVNVPLPKQLTIGPNRGGGFTIQFGLR